MSKTTDKQLIRAYLWQLIIRLAFSPQGKEQANWLRQYGQSIREFWEISQYPEHPRKDGGFKGIIDCTDNLNMFFEYSLETVTKFSIRFQYLPDASRKELMWEHHVDEKFFGIPLQTLLTCCKMDKNAIYQFENTDIEAVVDGLLLHPMAHQHISSPIDEHDIRIGGGLTNAFVYLFHLRYQFCPIPDKRGSERNRLLELFSSGIKNGLPITAHDLMAQPN